MVACKLILVFALAAAAFGQVPSISNPPGGKPAAPPESVQFNNSGAFGGSANFYFDVGSGLVGIGDSGGTFIGSADRLAILDSPDYGPTQNVTVATQITATNSVDSSGNAIIPVGFSWSIEADANTGILYGFTATTYFQDPDFGTPGTGTAQALRGATFGAINNGSVLGHGDAVSGIVAGVVQNGTSPSMAAVIGQTDLNTQMGTAATGDVSAFLAEQEFDNAAVAPTGIVSNFWGEAPVSGSPASIAIPAFMGFYQADLGPDVAAGGITNPYYSWYDSQGVGRCKEDDTFNSVGQSVCVVYNPQVTKYTPGAADFERIVYGQWESNVAYMGPEAGGTGTLRPLMLTGSTVGAVALATTGAATGKTLVCADTNGILYRSSSGVTCAN